MGYEAKIICHSISAAGKELFTVQAKFPRYLLAEVNTHRALSRSSASSRAIPVETMIQRVLDDSFIPESFLRNKKGMQGGAALAESEQTLGRLAWIKARDAAVEGARILAALGVHKQYANRLLEPFMWHTAILSGTEWDNMFHQRISPLSQPQFKTISLMIYRAMQASVPTLVEVGGWHLPYISDDERESLSEKESIEVSVARCARVSYLTQEGKRDIDEDMNLYKRLESGNHWSPFEHVATPHLDDGMRTSNFIGWEQLRSQFPNQNVTKFVLPPEFALQEEA